jgi:hypothetical protein
MWILRNHDFFGDKSMSSICNKYWLPLGSTSEKMQEEWNISQGDLSVITEGLEEIRSYEEFNRKAPEEDPEEDYESIRRERMKRSA